MNYIKYNILIAALLWSSISVAINIDFKGSTVIIIGSFDQVAIHGQENSSQVTFTDLLDGHSLASSVDHKVDGETLKLAIKGNERIRINIPSHLNVICKPVPIIYAGSYVYDRDAHVIQVYNTSGEVEINGDGYKVYLARTSGSISVVSHESIYAMLPNLNTSSIVSLDTYLGNVDVRVPHTLDPKIKASAPKGTITIKGDKSLFDSENATGNKLILHTEGGKRIRVNSIHHLPMGPSNLALRDQLIKMYIEDQGKKRMDQNNRIELTGMGFGAFIEAMPDVYKGHKIGLRHKQEFDAIVAKYGFPTKEMVGEGYPMAAVRQIVMQSKPEYFEKYRSQFVDAFGEGAAKMFERYKKGK